MYRDSNEDFLVLFFAPEENPLGEWDQHVENGYIKRVVDHVGASSVPALEIMSTKVNSTYVACPRDSTEELGISLPYLNIVMKYLDKYFTFEITVIDDMNMKRKFRASNFQSKARVKPHSCALPMKLVPGWNQIKLNLPDFVKRAYGTNYVETLKVTVYANCRIGRICFTDRLYSEDEVPTEYKLIIPSDEEEE